MILPAYATETFRPDLNRDVGAWVHLRCFGTDGDFGPHASMAVLEDGRLIGGVVFHNWHPESGVIELSAAASSRRWMTAPVIRCAFGFVFDEMHAQLAVMRVAERNEHMIRIADRLGFDGYFIPRMRGRDEGEVIFTLAEEDWRDSPLALRGERR